jgi:hypothetical protein
VKGGEVAGRGRIADTMKVVDKGASKLTKGFHQ